MSKLCNSAHMWECLVLLPQKLSQGSVFTSLNVRNKTPAMRDGWRPVFSSPAMGDKSPPASPVCHCQQDWRGSEITECCIWGTTRAAGMCNMWQNFRWKEKYGRNIQGVGKQSAVMCGLGVLNLLKVCALVSSVWAVVSDMTDDSTR